ncbi:MAG: hypothetical protein KJ968_01760 [Nanoarchaeota archaeon]|nr:hypothetical protein [Nanoarchaeota archaeon]
MNFEKEKKDCLNKIDKSKKGSIDRKIKELVDLINSLKDYYSTSSCSGRILLIKRPKSGKKCDVGFLFESHDKVSFEEIKACLKNIPEQDLWFRQESMILHVACRTIENAQKILDLCSLAGFKHSGIITTRKKIVVEIIGSNQFDTIIAKHGRVFVSDEHLRLLVNEANKKLGINSRKIKRFYGLIKSLKAQMARSS